MKKILIAHTIHVLLEQRYTFLNRTDIKLFVAETTDKALKIHLKEHADLIIAELDMPGLPAEQFCSLIRKNANLRQVSIIMVCPDTPAAIERSGQCGANAALPRPVHPIVLMDKAQQLLDIAARGSLRVILGVAVESRSGEESFFCRTRNISATGMLIETDRPLAEGDVLSCQFYLPTAKKVQASAKVVRTLQRGSGDEDFQYGLMFVDIALEVRQNLIEYVETTLR